jgi:hypothetical protein
VVFAAEQKLGFRPGGLSLHLGYVPAGAKGDRSRPDVVEAVLRDATPDEKGREAVLAVYRVLSRRE